MRWVPLVLAALAVSRVPGTETEGRISASAGAPRVAPEMMTPVRLLTRAEYEGTADSKSVHRWPTSLDDTARYAAVKTDGATRTVVVQGSPTEGYRLVLDCDADGDLTNDAVVPTTLADEIHVVTFESPDACAPLKLGLPSSTFSTKFPLKGRIFEYLWTERSGSIAVDSRPVAFVLQGFGGRYDHDGAAVYFDRNGDGIIDTTGPACLESDERFGLGERYVNLGGRTYTFEVDRRGDTLALTPSLAAMADRVSLEPGSLAPDFSFVDLSGTTHQLWDYRGRVVLLYAWATWCGPCKQLIPHLLEARAQFGERGLEILGVNKQEMPEVVQAYVREHALPWLQTVDDGLLLDFYRIEGLPRLILIARDGTIVDRNVRGPNLLERLADLFSQESPDPPTCAP